MDERQYHHLDAAGQPVGPVPLERLREMALAGDLLPDSLVWTEGWPDWQPASAVEGLTFAPPMTPRARVQPGFTAPRSPWGIPPMPPSSYTPESFMKLTWTTVVCTAIAVLGYVGGAIVFFGAMMASNGSNPPTAAMFIGLALMLGGALVGLAGSICGYFLVYRWWRQIQDGHAQTGPGKAVGFLFIPFFNYYWYFVAFWGLAKDLDAYTERYAISAPSAMPQLALTTIIATIVIALVAACAGVFGIVFWLPIAVMWFILIVRFSKISAIIAEHLAGRSTHVPIG
ncbi:MAG: GYF domain-containing protein [Phycisphaerales bacterium]